ncbi:allene oxide synthase-lipoxygenase protein-like isoform X2 [Biomphalaria glabrata]|uniref:Allene oxide synthase-lipoxygenase protein-like isoform X2 n=1 Tax=Biomphalaria glabrata TaxID=6526 RepID=A0A9W3B4U4_BIOGL|nr:allene oxide synthase-lipoxygenase protein-like isoform X2 [Biomphalaria glabrata]
MLSFIGLSSYDYKVEIKTGDRIGAGTDANVWIKLYDDIGRSTPAMRLEQVFKNTFEQCSTDHFEISASKTKNLKKDGPVARIEFWRDNCGPSSDWYVDIIYVTNKVTKSKFVFPVYRWVKANYHYKLKHLNTSLPQYEDEDLKEHRKMFLDDKRKSYRLDQKFPKEFPNGPVQVNTLPDDEKFSFNDKFSMGSLTVQLKVSSKIISFTRTEWKSLADILTVYVPPHFPKPERSSLWMDDAYFGFQRLASVNHSVIKLVTAIPNKFPVTEEHLKPFLGGLSIKEAIQQKRLFICDLEILDGLPVKQNMTLCAPIALFFGDISGQLRPVAIQLFQKPGSNNPIFTPSCPSLTWTLVKMWYNNADSAHQQALTHLGFTHLLMESFSLATQRNLSHSHPVYKILAPHFLNIIAINSLAVSELVSDGGWVDQTMNYGNKGMYALVVKGFKDWRLDVEGTLPEDLKRRGLDDPNILPCYYYRDDGILLYNAISKYVLYYLNLYYTTPNDVVDDHELQNWAQELVKERNFEAGGMGIKGIPGNGSLSTVDQIHQIVTSTIFTCSVAHAATNFPQYDEYGFPPNYPASLFGKPPSDPRAILTEQDILKCLPDKEQTLTIMTMTKLLSNKGTKSLGDFEVQYIVDPKAQAVVDRYPLELGGLRGAQN